MEIVFFSGVTLSIILFLWQFTVCLSGYNRTYGGINETMLQGAVVYTIAESATESSSSTPSFHEDLTEDIVTRYVDETLPKSTIGGDYSIDFAFSSYQYFARGVWHNPMKVTITLNYSSPAYSASRSKSFRITQGAAHES